MTSAEIRQKYLDFFKEKKHVILPSAPLIPENDPTVLFTTAGMHPLVPFLMGEAHPAGTRLTSCQKCIRTGDIEEVGDRWHVTFFEMLGNWSLGDYFKKEAIHWTWEFLTDKKWLGINRDNIYVTVFKGDETAPKDEETFDYWRQIGVAPEKIFYFGKESNWWGPAGKTGPCGPDTEIYYDTGLMPCGPECNPTCNCGKYFEVCNDVFMQYNKKADGSYELLKHKNVDTGMGLDRIAAVMQGKKEVYDIDVFQPIMEKISQLAKQDYDKAREIIADHLRAATFLIADGVSPSNLDQGYVLRRLIRRAIRYGKRLGIEDFFCGDIASVVIDIYKNQYPELETKKSEIICELVQEEEKFKKSLNTGLRLFNKIKENKISGKQAFDLYQSYGFPLELIIEEAKKNNIKVDIDSFNQELMNHKKLSKDKSQGKFAGGLADASEQSRQYHTATHLLHKALKIVLGDHVQQKGSNINAERLRFDFSHPEKMTKEQIAEVEAIINDIIQQNICVNCTEMDLEEAKNKGAIGLFANKYGEKVKVYNIGDFSKEICGGPHVTKTGELGHFQIIKEEASSSGVRRIKARLIHSES
jgi:alanyl-tRNA synthetase